MEPAVLAPEPFSASTNARADYRLDGRARGAAAAAAAPANRVEIPPDGNRWNVAAVCIVSATAADLCESATHKFHRARMRSHGSSRQQHLAPRSLHQVIFIFLSAPPTHFLPGGAFLIVLQDHRTYVRTSRPLFFLTDGENPPFSFIGIVDERRRRKNEPGMMETVLSARRTRKVRKPARLPISTANVA